MGTNLLLLLVAAVGNAALLVWALNWSFGTACPRWLLDLQDRATRVLIVALPAAFVWFFGIHGPHVLSTGQWTALPSPLVGYLGVCWVLGGIVVPLVTVARLARRPITQQLSNHSRVVDMAEHLGSRPVGRGKHRYLTRLPGNELFQLELAEKQYHLRRLPREWDGLSILHVTDLHFIGTIERRFFEAAIDLATPQDCDLVAVTGDLIDDDRFCEWVVPVLERLKPRLGTYCILGNHDSWYDAAAVRRAVQQAGAKWIGGQWETLERSGRKLLLAGTEWPWMGQHPDLAGAPADAFRLLLSHTPDNIRWARRQEFDLMLAGHNHGGQICFPVIGPVFVPSRYSRRYDRGAFYEEPTLLYVSRGLSGSHPVRYRSKPEITRLVLRCPV